PAVSHATAPTRLSSLSLHDALPIFLQRKPAAGWRYKGDDAVSILRVYGRLAVASLRAKMQYKLDFLVNTLLWGALTTADFLMVRSEEHTSELQSRENLVCRLLLEKK